VVNRVPTTCVLVLQQFRVLLGQLVGQLIMVVVNRFLVVQQFVRLHRHVVEMLLAQILVVARRKLVQMEQIVEVVRMVVVDRLLVVQRLVLMLRLVQTLSVVHALVLVGTAQENRVAQANVLAIRVALVLMSLVQPGLNAVVVPARVANATVHPSERICHVVREMIVVITNVQLRSFVKKSLILGEVEV